MDDPTRMPSDALAPVDEDPAELLWRMTVAEQVADLAVVPPMEDAHEVLDGTGSVVAVMQEQPVREPWRIEDDGGAEWAMAVLAEAEADIAAVLAHVEAVKRRAEEWADRVVNERRHGDGGRVLPSLLESRRIMVAHLEWYGRRQRADADRATVDLISGAVRTRASNKGGAVVIEDQELVVEWAKGVAPELVRVKEDVLVSELRKYVTTTKGGKLRLQAPAGDDDEPDPRPAVVLDAIPGVAIEPEGLTVTVAPRTVER